MLRGPVKVKLANDWLNGWAVNFKWLHMTWHEEFIISILVKKSLRGVLIACRRRWYKPSRRFMFTHNWTHWQFQKKIISKQSGFLRNSSNKHRNAFYHFRFQTIWDNAVMWRRQTLGWCHPYCCDSTFCVARLSVPIWNHHGTSTLHKREEQRKFKTVTVGWWWLG